MDLKTYIAVERGRAAALAARLGVSPSYLSQMANGQSPISPERCVDIWRETDGEVTRQDLRPNDWHRIWPELDAERAARGIDDPLPSPDPGSDQPPSRKNLLECRIEQPSLVERPKKK